jgi:hypothetical protein
MLAPHAREAAAVSPQAGLPGDHGQAQAARGVRFLNAPQLLAAARALQPPARIIARLMVLTVCVWVEAA